MIYLYGLSDLFDVWFFPGESLEHSNTTFRNFRLVTRDVLNMDQRRDGRRIYTYRLNTGMKTRHPCFWKSLLPCSWKKVTLWPRPVSASSSLLLLVCVLLLLLLLGGGTFLFHFVFILCRAGLAGVVFWFALFVCSFGSFVVFVRFWSVLVLYVLVLIWFVSFCIVCFALYIFVLFCFVLFRSFCFIFVFFCFGSFRFITVCCACFVCFFIRGGGTRVVGVRGCSFFFLT